MVNWHLDTLSNTHPGTIKWPAIYYLRLYIVFLFSDLQAIQSECAPRPRAARKCSRLAVQIFKPHDGEEGKQVSGRGSAARVHGNFEPVIRKIRPASRYLARPARLDSRQCRARRH